MLYTIKYEQNSLFSTPIYLGYVGDPEPGKEIIGTNGVVEWLLLKDRQECYQYVLLDPSMFFRSALKFGSIVTESEYGLLSIVETDDNVVPPRVSCLFLPLIYDS